MHLVRLSSKLTCAAAICLLVAACAGCWEKIEYTGSRATAGSQQKSSAESHPSAKPEVLIASAPEAQKQPAESVPEVPATSLSPPEAAPPTIVEMPAANPTEDLYSNAATPEKNLPAESSASSTSASPEPSSVVGDRYSLSTPSNTAPVDTSPPKSTSDEPNQTTATSNSAAESNPAASQPQSAVPTASSAMTPTRAAWLLGSRMSLAALAHDRGIAAQNVPVWFADAKSASTFLGTSIDELPEPAAADDTSPASRQAINYLLVNGQRIGRELAKQQGTEQSAIFEIALKSNLLLLLYTPGTSAGDSIATAISKAAPQAKLPDELWQPLVDALNKRMSQTDVRSAVRKMHGDIERYLAQSVEQRGK